MKVLLLSTVREYYRQHAGLFLVILFVLFGFLSSREHYAFALFFLKDPNGMTYLLGLWLLYSFFAGYYVQQLWTQARYLFIYHLRLLPAKILLWRLSVMAFGLHLPLILYAFYLTLISIQEKILNATLPLSFFLFGLNALLVLLAVWRLRNPGAHAQKSRAGGFLPFPRPKNWIFWTLEWLLRERGITVLISKTGVFLAMTAALVYDSTGTYDLRLPAVGFTLAYLLNCGLLYEIYHWNYEIWRWTRNLPRSANRRLIEMLVVSMLCLLPETLLIYRYGTRFSGMDILQLNLLGVGCVVLYYVQLYRKAVLFETSIYPVFAGFIVLTLAILYHIPLALLAAGLLVAAWLGWHRWRV
ncbi:hypothetical protein [Arundinibacter roseus]|uniref:Uncharacterized protein n=1 Tax=Arundinibacter roseus TaxID=2070510 RepID=A0A4R4K5Q2_9BACT|nr:hypothetical protein [Arundinibacter roseus]TDB61856.1 hypothetical protein EZE20_19135 [Arundinibacter roseus]